MTKTIDIFEVKVEFQEYEGFVNTYPEDIERCPNGMGEIWKEKKSGLEVARMDHGFFNNTYTLYKFKK